MGCIRVGAPECHTHKQCAYEVSWQCEGNIAYFEMKSSVVGRHLPRAVNQLRTASDAFLGLAWVRSFSPNPSFDHRCRATRVSCAAIRPGRTRRATSTPATSSCRLAWSSCTTTIVIALTSHASGRTSRANSCASLSAACLTSAPMTVSTSLVAQARMVSNDTP